MSTRNLLGTLATILLLCGPLGSPLVAADPPGAAAGNQARPNIHRQSTNASKTKPAKLLVFMIKDKGKPVTIPAASGH